MAYSRMNPSSEWNHRRDIFHAGLTPLVPSGDGG